MSLLNYFEPWNMPFSYGRVNFHDEAFLSRKMHKLASFVKGHLSWKTSLESTLDNLRTANADWEEKPQLCDTETSFRPRCTSEDCLPEWGNWTEYKALWNLPTPLKSTAWLDSYSCPAASTCPGHACPGTSTRLYLSGLVANSDVHFSPWTSYVGVMFIYFSVLGLFGCLRVLSRKRNRVTSSVFSLFKTVSPVVSHGKPGIALEFQEIPCHSHSSLFVVFYRHFFILFITVQEAVLFNQVKLKKLIILCIFHNFGFNFQNVCFFFKGLREAIHSFFLIFFPSCSRTC